MNAPPRHEAESLDIVASEAAERERFVELRERAGHLGHTLRRSSGGYVLQRWTYSRHVIDLDTIAQLLKSRPGKVA